MTKRSVLPVLALFPALLAWFPLSPAPQTSPDPPAKKVWTNEDLAALRATAPVSAPGAAPHSDSQKQSSTEKSEREARAKKAQRYRQQLQPLYAELPKIDAQIAEMQRFEDGSYQSTGGVARFGAQPLNPADRINMLQKREREIHTQIGEIEDQARHDGVLPGDLR